MRTQFNVSLIEEVAIQILKDPRFQTKLAVRSSSSMEDLPGQSGAGLYDSVIGV
jgi:phosphoenolpyruvate synthase/pyruvate phosphate dikinase